LILGVEMNITDSTFMNGYSSMGGAIFMSGSSSLNIKKSQFLNNYASDSGGAMYFRGFNQVKITEQTKFNANQAKVSGGDIFAFESERNLTLQDVTLENL
jgi:predicted outer membrane repeat protein